MNAYWFKFLLYLDIFVGSLCARDPDITISSYCGLALRNPNPGFWQRIARGLGHTLNFISKNHCEGAIAHDIVRANAAIKILT
jgi:hypothetical protein